MEIVKMNENIYRLVTPYKDIWTTVYLIKTEKGDLLFDAASFPEDAEQYTLPFLKQCGVTPQSLKYIFISHDHSDHAGGLGALMEHFPDTIILSRSTALYDRFAACDVVSLSEGDMVLDCLKVITVVGHTCDSAGLLDVRTNTFLSGDGLQVYGIVGSENWAANIRFPYEYFQEIEKIRKIKPSQIFAAHNYYPCGHIADGEEAVNRYLDACREPLLKLKEIMAQNPRVDNQGVCDIYNVSKSIPTFHAGVVKCLRKAIKRGKF